MAAAFSRSMRSLDLDGFRRSGAGLLLALLLLGGWAAWLLLARVAVDEVSVAARLEVDRAVHPVEPSVGGRVASISMTLGQEVTAGQVLAEIDAAAEQLQIQQERTRVAALAPQLDALRSELRAADRTLADLKEMTLAAVAEAKARQKEAETAASFAEEEADRKAKSGTLPEIEVRRAQGEAKKLRDAAESAKLAVTRLEWEYRTKENTQRERVEQLKRQVAEIDGAITTGTASIRRLEDEIDKRRIRAPIDGRIGELADLRVGSVVRPGDRIATIVPPGKVKIVADFTPQAALGRIRPGQRAQVRLEGFPWTQFGMLRATVSNVATEVRNGRVRVELAVIPDPSSAIPLQHGLPGTVEVEVDRVSPANLVLRSAGRLLLPDEGGK